MYLHDFKQCQGVLLFFPVLNRFKTAISSRRYCELCKNCASNIIYKILRSLVIFNKNWADKSPENFTCQSSHALENVIEMQRVNKRHLVSNGTNILTFLESYSSFKTSVRSMRHSFVFLNID